MTLAALAGASMTTAAQQGADAGEWRSYGGDTGSTKYSPLAQITPENVGDLAVAWRWESADGRFDLDNLRAYYPALQIGNDTRNVSINGLKGTPLMVGDTLYLTTALSQVAAIDAATGETRWIHDPQSYAAGIPIIVLGFSSRGLAYWTDGQVARIIWATGDAMLHAVDAATGEPGEWTSPTQPFPTKPPPYDRQGVTEADLIDFTPGLRADAVEILQDYVHGPMFTPPSLIGTGPGDTKGTIELPGYTGGANWNGAAV